MAEKHHPDWKQSDGWIWRAFRRRFAAPLLLVLIVIGFFWKLVLTNQFTWLASDDISTSVLPWFQFQASEWHAGRFPLWDPHAWGGQPLLAQAQPGAAYPLNWLLFLTPLKHTWIRQSALHWYYVLIRVLAALTLYWLCRDVGRSRAAALFGGVVYGTGGILGSLDWPQMVNSMVWAPLVFLFQFRVLAGVRTWPNAVLSGFFLGLMWLCGHHQIPLYVSLASLSLWLYFMYRRRGELLLAVLAMGVAMLVSGLQTLPTAEYGRLAQRWASTDHALRWQEIVPYAVHQQYSLKPLSLLSFAIPGMDLNANPFIGILGCGLALAGLILAWSDCRARWLAALAMGGVLFALGPNNVFHGILYATVPMLEKARVPSQALILFQVGACVLIAWGVDLFPALSKRAAMVASIALTAAGVVLSLTGFVLFFARVLPLAGGDSRFMITAFSALLGAVVLWMFWNGSISRNAATAGLLCLALLEIGNVTGYFFASYDQKDRTSKLRMMAEDADVIEYLRNQPGHPFRVEYDGAAIPHNIGDWWGIDTFSAYNASAPDLVMSHNPYDQRVQTMLGVQYYFGTKPLNAAQLEVFTGASGRKLYRNPAAFPRAWSVHQVALASTLDTARLLRDDTLDLTMTAIVTRPVPKLESCAGDAVRVSLREPDRVMLEAVMQCRGLVILSETYFPGWRASVDGKPAEIYDVNGFVRGVVAEKGRHRIEMQYRPRSVMWGGAMTAMGCCIALFAAVLQSRHK